MSISCIQAVKNSRTQDEGKRRRRKCCLGKAQRKIVRELPCPAGKNFFQEMMEKGLERTEWFMVSCIQEARQCRVKNEEESIHAGEFKVHQF